jgi:hypothetical protein
MRVEVLYFNGCPSYETLLPRLRELLVDVSATFELRLVESPEAAERERFLGSPTVRVDGTDIDPAAEQRTDFGLKCRLYPSPDGLCGVPPHAWLVNALAGACG